jgi:hypothetical protein
MGIDEKEDEETQWERNPVKERKEKKKSIVKCEPPIIFIFIFIKNI